MIDKIFKLGLIVLGAVFLFLYSQSSQSGRYIFNDGILDTVTGKIYVLKEGEITVLDLINRTDETNILIRR